MATRGKRPAGTSPADEAIAAWRTTNAATVYLVERLPAADVQRLLGVATCCGRCEDCARAVVDDALARQAQAEPAG